MTVATAQPVAVKERPIPFSAPMVRAIVAGIKTQTRRICKHRPGIARLPSRRLLPPAEWTEAERQWWIGEFLPYGNVGDRLWVREPATVFDIINERGVLKSVRLTYHADNRMSDFIPWPERLNFIPVRGKGVPRGVFREASRVSIEITRVRIERLHDITADDAMAEGVGFKTDDELRKGNAVFDGVRTSHPRLCGFNFASVGAFADLWETINGFESWNANPWVWVREFKRV